MFSIHISTSIMTILLMNCDNKYVLSSFIDSEMYNSVIQEISYCIG